MANNAQKTPLARSLHELGDIKSQDWLQRLPQRMPATVVAVDGPLITVSLSGNWGAFPIPTITIPKDESQWAREPTQVGDKGYINGIDYYIGGQSGQGGGNADLLPRANLTNATFQPISQKSLPVVDYNAYTISGPNGVVLEDKEKQCVFTLTPTGIAVTAPEQIVFTVAGLTFTFNGQGLTLSSGDVIIGSITLTTHLHKSVQPGNGESGEPVAP
jgi:hypothetical protein